MKKPDRLLGFIVYRDVEFPFEFFETSFTVSLYPPTQRVCEDYADLRYALQSWNDNSKKHEWISALRLYGTTTGGHSVVMEVRDSPTNYQGFLSFHANWYFCYKGMLSTDNIGGFRVTGGTAELFYPAGVALNTQVHFNADSRTVKKLEVSSNEYKPESCGKYRVTKHIDAILEIAAHATAHMQTSEKPIDATSTFTMLFSSPVNLDTLIKAYFDTLGFFKFITYRHNIDPGEVSVFYINEAGLRDFQGTLAFPHEQEIETDKKQKERVIKYNLLSEKTSKLFTAIKNRKYGFQYMCDSIGRTHSYPSSRIIMILAEFERAYRDSYRTDSGRSEKYLQTKQAVVDIIHEYQKTQNGKRREYVNQLKKYVENRDSSYGANLQRALLDCEDILTCFVRRRYDGSYAKAVEGISQRMGVVRNGIAHSRLDLRFDAIHLDDIKIIEELIYTLRLKKIALSDKLCQKAINDLFGENFAIS